MTARLPAGRLAAALAMPLRATPTKTSVPIVSCALLEAEDGRLAVTCTDLDVRVRTSAEADVGAPFVAAVPAARLLELARRLDRDAEVMLERGDGSLRLEAGRFRADLPALPAEEFPQAPRPEEPAVFELPAASLARLLGRTKFAMSTEEVRFYLNGVYLHPHGDVLRAVATDGHRLALVEEPLPEGAATMPGVILPRLAVRLFLELARDQDGPVHLEVGRNAVRAVVGTSELVTRLVGGTYPDYERVFPPEGCTRLEIRRGDLAAAAERMAVFAAGPHAPVLAHLRPGEPLLLEVRTDQGAAREEVACTCTGEPAVVGLSARYLAELCAEAEHEVLAIEASSPHAPLLIRGAGDDAPRSVILQMPMRV